MFAWSGFLICVALIVVAGVKLCRYGDIIADKTGLGGTWIGLVMVATVTSLPELATGIASVTVAAAPDIAIGDIHRIANPYDEPCHIIEVQCGDYLGEDDIVRLEDDYGREGTNT